MTVWTIQDEPYGTACIALVTAAARFCDRFSVYTTGMSPADSAVETLTRLQPFLVAVHETSVVPGSAFSLGKVSLHEFLITHESLAVITRATNRLYGWAEPALPNDLALLAGHRELMVVLASDEVATLDVTEEERRELLQAVPSLRLGDSVDT